MCTLPSMPGGKSRRTSPQYVSDVARRRTAGGGTSLGVISSSAKLWRKLSVRDISPCRTEGTISGGGLKDPPQWTEEPTIATSKPLTKKVKLEPREGADSSSQTPMRFDAETGSLVPFVDLTSE